MCEHAIHHCGKARAWGSRGGGQKRQEWGWVLGLGGWGGLGGVGGVVGGVGVFCGVGGRVCLLYSEEMGHVRIVGSATYVSGNLTRWKKRREAY